MLTTKILSRYITQKTLRELVEQIKSSDPRERDYVKTVLHRSYVKFMPMRSYIRKLLKQLLLECSQSNENEFGIAETLQLFTAIIQGFSKPLKGEHSEIFTRCLVPLHKSEHLKNFYFFLLEAIMTFIKKDSSVVQSLVNGFVRWWPKVDSNKQVVFLQGINDTLNHLDVALVPSLNLDRMLAKIALAVRSSHHRVAESALLILNNPRLQLFLLADVTDTVSLKIPGSTHQISQLESVIFRELTPEKKLRFEDF